MVDPVALVAMIVFLLIDGALLGLWARAAHGRTAKSRASRPCPRCGTPRTHRARGLTVLTCAKCHLPLPS